MVSAPTVARLLAVDLARVSEQHFVRGKSTICSTQPDALRRRSAVFAHLAQTGGTRSTKRKSPQSVVFATSHRPFR